MTFGTINREANRNPNNLVLWHSAGSYYVNIWRNHRWTTLELTSGQWMDVRDTCERTTLANGANRTNSATLAK